MRQKELKVDVQETNVVPEGVDVIDGTQLVGKVLDLSEPALLEYCINYLDAMPDSGDLDRVKGIQQKVAAGDYDFDQHLEGVASSLIQTSTEDQPISYPLFDRS